MSMMSKRAYAEAQATSPICFALVSVVLQEWIDLAATYHAEIVTP
jgi:hypothetical protein